MNSRGLSKIFQAEGNTFLKTRSASVLMMEQHGSPQGRDEEFWIRAERELIEAAQDQS